MMNAKLSVVAICAVALVTACTKDDFGRSNSVLANKSAHAIVVTPYRNGVPDSSLVRRMRPGDSVYVYQTSSTERTVAPTWPDELRRYDSIRVAFIDTTTGVRDTVRIAHLRPGLQVSYPKFIAATAARSLFNTTAWSEEVMNDSKYLLESRFTFTFTEADYRAAR